MPESNNVMTINFTPGNKLKLYRIDEPQTNADSVVFKLVWQSRRTTYHFANLYYYPSQSSPHFVANLLDEAGAASATFPLQSSTMRTAAIEVIETKVCF